MVFADRIQFAFTVMFHYLFPIITMGLGFFIAVFSTLHIVTGEEGYHQAAEFWARIFAIAFAAGVVTGIPLEFEFGANWSQFSAFGGGLFGQVLPLEGVYAFFLESGFLGLFLFGRSRIGRIGQWLAGLGVAVGSLLSGYFITAANAWMQHPVGYRLGPHGKPVLASFWRVVFNPYAGWMYAHVISGALLAGSFIVGSIGAFYLLAGRCQHFGRNCVRAGVIGAVVFSLLQLFPTGDIAGRDVARYQPIKLATMEGQFKTEPEAPLAILGMPDSRHGRLLDPVRAPGLLSFLAYGSFSAPVRGLDSYPRDLWPPVDLTYYAYHIMVGLGTVFIAIALVGGLLLYLGRLERSRWYLWILMLTLPFPFIANEAGWVVTEVGRQPWLVYGLLRTSAGVSPNVSTGEVIFTTLGFAGLYLLLGLLFLLLAGKVIHRGIEGEEEAPHPHHAAMPSPEPPRA